MAAVGVNALDILQDLSVVDSIGKLKKTCADYCDRLGFDNFIYAVRIPEQFSESKLVLVNGYPENWVEHYFEQDFAPYDPIMVYSASHVVPTFWHDLSTKKSSKCRQVMDEARDFGMRDGISMPVHSSHGELGVLSFSLSSASEKRQSMVLKEALPYVHILGGYVHEALRRSLGLDSIDVRLKLNSREQECLRWAADGKTSWEIGKILKISERTVNFHLNNAVVKMEASNRQHAIARAALQGLIQPRPF